MYTSDQMMELLKRAHQGNKDAQHHIQALNIPAMHSPDFSEMVYIQTLEVWLFDHKYLRVYHPIYDCQPFQVQRAEIVTAKEYTGWTSFCIPLSFPV